MDGAEKITERILQEADAAAAAIQTEAQTEATGILNQTKAEAQQARETILAKAEAKARETAQRMLTVAGLESRKAILEAKQDQISRAFEGALARLDALTAADYQRIIRPLLLESVQTGEESVIISPRDVDRITPEFIHTVNNELVRQGKAGKLSLADEQAETGGGFILSAGEVKINHSFLSVIKMMRDELEPEVAEILFR